MRNHSEPGSVYNLQINGLDIRAAFSEKAVSAVCLPILQKLTELYESKRRRVIALLAGPPASGKSTLAAFLQVLSNQDGTVRPIQSVGIDGFHYHADYIRTHTVMRDGKPVPMQDVKGCPESFDIDRLYGAVSALRDRDVSWPIYDRRVHDVVEDTVTVSGGVVLIEGNWLLLNEGKWAALRALADFTVMMRANGELLKQRLIERKIMGGLSPREAEAFYETSDRHNVLRCLSCGNEADAVIDLEQYELSSR